MLGTPPVHREGSLPRVRRLVNHISGSGVLASRPPTATHGVAYQRARKDKGRSLGATGLTKLARMGTWSKPWVCGKGLQRTAWEPLADSGRGDFIYMRNVFGNMQCRISTLPAGPHSRGF